VRKQPVFVLLLLLFASLNMYCSPTTPGSEVKKEGTTPQEKPTDTGSPDATSEVIPETEPREVVPETKPQPVYPHPENGWCSRLAPGQPGTKTRLLDLSMAHSKLRFFGIHGGYAKVDAVLAQALAKNGIDSRAFLGGYKEGSEKLCVLSTQKRELGKASVTLEGTIAYIKPGTGEIKLPEAATAIVLDLRELPAGPALKKALEKLVPMLLAKPVSRADKTVLKHDGMKDEYFSANNVYKNMPFVVKGGVFAAKAKKELPMVVLTGKLLAPSAALLAGELRLAKRAWLVGESIPAAVAESLWQPVGQDGIAFRVRQLSNDSVNWPDEIAADRPASELKTLLDSLAQKPAIPAVALSRPQRASVKSYNAFRAIHSRDVTQANVQAALLITHGALRAFFPYFKTVGDRIDERLKETMNTLKALQLTGASARNLLRRFGESIRDGHQFVNYFGQSAAKGYMLVQLDKLGGKPVVRYTGHSSLKVGDTILSIDGVAAADWFAKEYKRTSAATPGYQFDLAARELNTMTGPVELELRSVDGKTRKVTLQPQSYQAYQAFFKKPFRKPGFLSDVNGKDLYYVDIDNQAMTNVNLQTILQEMQKAKGLVLDMRGYPGQKSWTLLQHIATRPLPSPLFVTHEWTGPLQMKKGESKYTLPALSPQFKGPVAFLIGPRSVSSAEHVSTMLKQIKRVTFIGRTTAGTNGNITGLILPAALSFSFTGMEILYTDRKPFHGIGIVPDIKLAPTAADLAKGNDVVLKKAVEFLNKQ
jgi:C-terminal processing protease CtpA/Prc